MRYMEEISLNIKDINGYINLDSASQSKRVIVLGENSYAAKFIDTKTGEMYYFKYNATSGGWYHANKEIYESIISRLISHLMPAQIYSPAIFNKKEGVITRCFKYRHITFDEYLSLFKGKFDNVRNNVLSIYDNENLLKQNISQECFDMLTMVPQNYMVGNLDFKFSNMVVEGTEFAKNPKAFDFGFNMFLFAQKGESLGIKSIDECTDHFFRQKIGGVGMGVGKSIGSYASKSEFLQDIKELASTNPRFKEQINNALTITDDIIDEEFLQMYGDEGVTLGKAGCIVRETIKINREDLSRTI